MMEQVARSVQDKREEFEKDKGGITVSPKTLTLDRLPNSTSERVVRPGIAVSEAVTITNKNPFSVKLTAAKVTRNAQDAFAVLLPTQCPLTIPPQMTVSVGIECQPRASGVLRGIVMFSFESPQPPAKREDENMCVVCLERKAEWRPFPCGHVCLCESDAVSLKNRAMPCPLCRVDIEGVMKAEHAEPSVAQKTCFSISRYARLRCGDPDLHNCLKPTVAYEKKKRPTRRTKPELEEGERPEGSDGRWVRDCDKYKIPKHVDESIARGDLDQELDRLKKDLSFSTYHKLFHMLLYAEEAAMWVDIATFNMDNALMSPNGRFLNLTVPGLAENRFWPSRAQA
mmetsp:Transcript_8200/g.20022  ORF Transcript_8200/g.20022 Transcript_8200/m.20022 type:complete len:341 (-) Transcript_8200:542-1564(-)